jgi:hypothetical protein
MHAAATGTAAMPRQNDPIIETRRRLCGRNPQRLGLGGKEEKSAAITAIRANNFLFIRLVSDTARTFGTVDIHGADAIMPRCNAQKY